MIRRALLVLFTATILAGCSTISFRRIGIENGSNDLVDTPTSIRVGLPTETTAPLKPTDAVSPDVSPQASPTEVTASPAVAPTEEASLASQVVRFTLQPGAPVYVGNFLFPESGCDWSGVAGQVFGDDGVPVEDLVVEVSGEIQGEPVVFLAITGSEANIGPGGFVIPLSDMPLETDGSLSIQLLDLAGLSQSESIPIRTFSACERNLAIINFVETSTMHRHFLPLLLDIAKPTN